MAVLEILKFPDPRLRKKCAPVTKVTPELQSFAKDMLETMYSFKGIGLAAAQVDRQIRLFVADCRPSGDSDRYEMGDATDLEKAVVQPLIIFNPVIVKKEGKTTYDEGCLSVPGYYETVERFEYVEVTGLDIEGQPLLIKADGLLSICMQHEIDHLDGKVFIDRLSTIKANRLKSKIKKFGYDDPNSILEKDEHKEPVL